MGDASDIEEVLGRARAARARGELATVRRLLAEAQRATDALDEAHPLRSVVAWRRAKAAYDAGESEEILDALAAVLSTADPFAAYPQGLAAVEPIARRCWDELGYGLDAVEALWEAYIGAQQERGDPWLAACGRSQLAWSWACEGRLDELWQLLVEIGGLGPRDFGDGPTRHPRATDAATSVFFAQMDVARSGLRAAVWGRDERLGREADEVYADALAEAGVEPDYWYVECAARAALCFGWRSELPSAWPGAAAALSHERADLHRALAAAEVGGEWGALRHAVPAADAAGPEWGTDVRLALAEAQLDDAPRWRDEASRRARRFGLDVFTARLSTARSP